MVKVFPPERIADGGDGYEPELHANGNKFCTAVRALDVEIRPGNTEELFSGNPV
jgi:hypothetical protein